MLTGTLKRLIVMVALVGSFGGGSHRRAPARRLPALPVEDGCRELPAPAPATPPPPATCS
jgi:hypothetical protein